MMQELIIPQTLHKHKPRTISFLPSIKEVRTDLMDVGSCMDTVCFNNFRGKVSPVMLALVQKLTHFHFLPKVSSKL